ncbi:MAG: EI24 domain-containing protein [Bacteroidota bacterium]
MRFFKNFLFGLRAYWKALRFIKEHKLYWFALIPAILMLFMYYFGTKITSRHYVLDDKNMNSIIWSMVRLYFEIIVGFTLMHFAKYIVVILLSPLFSYLSVKSEHILTGNSYTLSAKQYYNDIIRGVRIGFRNLFLGYLFFAILYFAAFIGWEQPEKSPIFFLTFVVWFFYYGFSFLDYVNERLRWNVDESVDFIRKHRGLAISIGLVYSLMILVPLDLTILFTGSSFTDGIIKGSGIYLLHLLLWICASFAPILAIVAATIAMNDVVDLRNKKLKTV